jgi:hypothetical protein
LYPLESGVYQSCEGLCESGLTRSRNILQQNVPTGKKGGQQQPAAICAAPHHRRDIISKAIDEIQFAKCNGLWFRGHVHLPFIVWI